VRLLFRVKFFQLREQLHVIFRYYRNLRFALVDIGFCASAFFFNPTRIARKFTGTHSYGETPLRTFAHLAKAVGLTASDHFLDLGAGRGKLCFWSALWIGCTSSGIEQVPWFVRQSRCLAYLFNVPVHISCGSIAEADLSKATVVYLYTMEWDEAILARLAEGARLITVGAPVENGLFEVVKVVSVKYPWGVTEGYIQHRKAKTLNPAIGAVSALKM
jgi:hypothetical protein